MTACAVCGSSEGRLDPYRDVAEACGWEHPLAHLDCARYRVSTVWLDGHLGVEEYAPGLYRYVWREVL